MEKFRIFDQNSGLTPWKNSDFFTFLKSIFIVYRKHFFLSRISTQYISMLIFFFWKKQRMEKIRIFNQNRGLTRLEKFNFFHCFKEYFYSLESLSFHLEYQLKYISRLIVFEKQTMEKFRIFDENRGLIPLKKIQLFSLL